MVKCLSSATKRSQDALSKLDCSCVAQEKQTSRKWASPVGLTCLWDSFVKGLHQQHKFLGKERVLKSVCGIYSPARFCLYAGHNGHKWLKPKCLDGTLTRTLHRFYHVFKPGTACILLMWASYYWWKNHKESCEIVFCTIYKMAQFQLSCLENVMHYAWTWHSPMSQRLHWTSLTVLKNLH